MFLLPDVPRANREDSDNACRTLERSSSVRKYPETHRFAMHRSINTNSLSSACHETSSSASLGSFSRFLYDNEDGWLVANYHTFERPYEAQDGSTHKDNDRGIISAHLLPQSIESMKIDNAHCSKTIVESHKIWPNCLHWQPRQINSIKQEVNGSCITEIHHSKVPQTDGQTSVVRGKTAKCTKAQRLILNVGGVIFETLEATLSVHPNTLLGDPERRIKYLNHHTGEFIFHRRFTCFDAILFFYQSNGILAKPQTVDQLTFESELVFFEIPLVKSKSLPHTHCKLAQPKRGWQQGETMVRTLRRLFNRPFSSPLSSIIATLNILVTILLISEFCVSTLSKNRRLSPVDPVSVLRKGERFKALAAAELSCMLFLNVDFVIRLLLSQQRFRFLISHLSIIDIVTMLSYHCSVLLSNLNIGFRDGYYLHLLRQIRILQMFRLSRYNHGFRSLLQTISRSLTHLWSFILIIPIMSTCFASMMFVFEEGHYIQDINCLNRCKPFGSLSDWFWYSIITITTVGYGDVYPRTVFGKIIGTVCALFGVILFCLLTPVIFRQFVEQYYIPKLNSRKIDGQERRLAENMRDMYCDGHTN